MADDWGLSAIVRSCMKTPTTTTVNPTTTTAAPFAGASYVHPPASSPPIYFNPSYNTTTYVHPSSSATVYVHPSSSAATYVHPSSSAAYDHSSAATYVDPFFSSAAYDRPSAATYVDPFFSSVAYDRPSAATYVDPFFSSAAYAHPTSAATHAHPTYSTSTVAYVHPNTSAAATYVHPSYSAAATYVHPTSSAAATYVHSTYSSGEAYVHPSSPAYQNLDFQHQFHFQNNNLDMLFPDPLLELRNLGNIENLQDLSFDPNIPNFQPLVYPQGQPISPFSVLGNLQDRSPPQPPQQAERNNVINPGPKYKRRYSRKLQQKKKDVYHVTANNLSRDRWSWRKYGQKPIKGSPHPRGYYRCSTMKECMARKYMERSKFDPNVFVISFTGEHCHPMPFSRNSLAGNIRQRSVTNFRSINPSRPSPISSVSLSPAATSGLSHVVNLSPAVNSGLSHVVNLSPAVNSGLSQAVTPSPVVTPAASWPRLEDIWLDEFDMECSTVEFTEDFFEGLEEITGAMNGEAESVPDDLPFSCPTNDGTTTAGASI